MRIKELVKASGGRLLSGNGELDIDPAGIFTDSRAVRRGGIFIALKGPKFDGNKYAGQALRKGASGAVVSDRGFKPFASYDKVIVEVKDTTKALQHTARYHRSQFEIPVIGVTGSNGKTTVKEMIYAILSTRYDVLKNEGTKNNHIGLPQTLLRLSAKNDICVVELGANHSGEIRSLAGIAMPTMAVVTNVGPSHLEYFGSLGNVYKAKRELPDAIKLGGLAVVNGDDRFFAKYKRRGIKIIRFGMRESNDHFASDIRVEGGRIRFLLDGKNEFVLNILGRHNVYNALAAIAVALQFGISISSIKRALGGFRPVKMRMDLMVVNGISIINDAYNSNPISMQQALETIRSYPAIARWVVSADMLELGSKAKDFHRTIGESVALSGIDGLLTFGKMSRHTLSQARSCGMAGTSLWHCSSHDEIAAVLNRVAKRGDAILLKGSRLMRLEEVLSKLKR